MKTLGEFLRSTIIGGLLIMLPLGLVIWLGAKFLDMLTPLAGPITELLPARFRYPMVIALVLLLALSLGAGLLAHTRAARSVGRFVEDSALSRIPGYSTIRSLTHRLGDDDETRKLVSAFVELEDALVIAFIIETHVDGRYTVFVPSAPTPAAGSIYIMESSRVHVIDAPFMDAVKCVSKFGVGSARLLASKRT